MKLKFVWNGIKVEGKLYRCWYSDGKLLNHPEGTLTIYARDYYPHIPLIPGLTVQNDSDSMTDYFEKDRIRVIPSSPYYFQVRAALMLQNEHNRKRCEKRYSSEVRP